MLATQGCHSFQAAHAGHVQVHEHDVRLKRAHSVEAGRTIGNSCAQLQARTRAGVRCRTGEHARQQAAHHGGIVGCDDANRFSFRPTLHGRLHPCRSHQEG